MVIRKRYLRIPRRTVRKITLQDVLVNSIRNSHLNDDTMSNLEKEIKLLKDNILELMFTVKSQLEKGREALVEFDEEIARQVIINEKRVDSLELTIDRDCAKLLALYNPVAVDLRFVMAVFK